MKDSVPYLLLKVLRPQQWVKNLVCFAGLIFSGKLRDPDARFASLVAFLAFCAAASATYLFNDFCDRKRDAENPRTANRPLASGKLPLTVAVAVWLGLVAAALGLAIALNGSVVIVIVAYLAANFLYSVRIKATVIVDVICIAIGFVFRVLVGVYAVDVLPTPWIVLCMFVLALFLGFCKRRGELIQLGDAAPDARPVLRKYTIAFLEGAIQIAAGLSIMTYAIYTTSSEHSTNLVITVVPVIYCVFRYYYKVVVEKYGESPEKLLYRDPLLWLGIFSWVALVVLVVYVLPKEMQLFTTSVPHQKP